MKNLLLSVLFILVVSAAFSMGDRVRHRRAFSLGVSLMVHRKGKKMATGDISFTREWRRYG